MKAPKRLLTVALMTAVTGCATLGVARPPEHDAELRLERGLAALDAGRHGEAFDDLAWVYSHCAGRQAGSHALIALAALELDARNRSARPDVGAELLARAIRDPGVPAWVRALTETTFLAALALGAPHPDPDTPDRDPAGADRPVVDADEDIDREVEAEAEIEAEAEAEAEIEIDAQADVEGDVDGRADRVTDALEPGGAAAGRAYGCGPIVASGARLATPLPALPGPSMAALLARSEARRDALAGRTGTLEQELAAVREQLQATRAELERIRKTLSP